MSAISLHILIAHSGMSQAANSYIGAAEVVLRRKGFDGGAADDLAALAGGHHYVRDHHWRDGMPGGRATDAASPDVW